MATEKQKERNHRNETNDFSKQVDTLWNGKYENRNLRNEVSDLSQTDSEFHKESTKKKKKNYWYSLLSSETDT